MGRVDVVQLCAGTWPWHVGTEWGPPVCVLALFLLWNGRTVCPYIRSQPNPTQPRHAGGFASSNWTCQFRWHYLTTSTYNVLVVLYSYSTASRCQKGYDIKSHNSKCQIILYLGMLILRPILNLWSTKFFFGSSNLFENNKFIFE